MKLLFALPGFHRYDRGAEIALLEVAGHLAALRDEVTVAGSGPPRAATPYRYVRVPSIRRERLERLPTFPPFRSETGWEDASFAAGLAYRVGLRQFDATVTCSFPFTHWALRRAGRGGPAHVFVTQNGDWPAYSRDAEFRLFDCDGLVCTNRAYFERNRSRWRCELIPNGVDRARFTAGVARRADFAIPGDGPVVLMVSALIDSKRVLEGIKAVAELENVTLVVAGDGPLRQEVTALADLLLPGRFRLLTVDAAEMPDLYRSADVFLHLSMVESFGNVFLEAWASGLPVVGHAGEPASWILGDGHFLCDTRDTGALQGALRAALASPRLGEQSAGLERFAWTAIARQYRAFLAGVVEDRQAARVRK